MRNRILLSITLFSYKNKNLKDIIENLTKNTINQFELKVIDQHPIDRSKQISSIGDNVSYTYKQWYDFAGPIFHKNQGIIEGTGDFLVSISDDFYPQFGWDEKVIKYLQDKPIVVSGKGKNFFVQKDPFSLKIVNEPSHQFSITNIIDRTFMFGTPEILINSKYPTKLKYYGEEEAFSMALYSKGIDIHSAPSDLYEDLNQRIVEKLYTTFSLEHNYNLVIDLLSGKPGPFDIGKDRTVEDFLKFHKIDISKLYRLPFPKNDAEYDPEDLEYGKVDGRRFVAGLKAIY
jgi:hypothetical protein